MNIDSKMAWRNLWRNPRRTILTALAIAFASLLLVFMLSLQLGSYDTMINASVMIHTGHLHIEHPDYQDKMNIRLVVRRPSDIMPMFNATPGLKHYTFRANAFALVSSRERSFGVMITGIDPQREALASTIKDTIRQGRYLNPDDSQGVLLGNLLARNLKVGVGDELTVMGQGRDGSVAATVLKVRGIYRTGLSKFDRSSMQITLANFQDTFAMGKAVHQVVVVCDSLQAVPGAKKYLAERLGQNDMGSGLTVKDWQQLMPGLVQSIQMDLFSGLIFYLLLIIVVAFSIANTFLMSVLERMHEFGVLMALGTTPRRLARLVIVESLSLTLVGISAGVGAGALLTWYFQVYGIDLSGMSEVLEQFGITGIIYPQLSIWSLTVGPGLVFVITILTALLPAFKVLRLRPVEALYHA